MYLTFPSSLMSATSEWLYSLPPHSLHNFSEVTKAFLTQYATRQEAKRSSHHFLSVRMRPGDSPKSYITSSKISSPKSPIAVRKYLHSRSSVGCRLLAICTSNPEAQRRQDERDPFLSTTIHLARGGNKDFLQPPCKTK